MDKNGKTDPNGGFVEVKLQEGGFVVDATKLNAATAKAAPLVDSATCSLFFKSSALVTFFGGKGLYRGISGSATVTLSFAAVTGRYASGTDKGRCIRNQVPPPFAQLGFIGGQGSVKFA